MIGTRKNKAFLLALMLPLAAFSQKLEEIWAFTEGNKIVVTYHLDDPFKGDHFNVQLFASHNQFSSPVKMVSGDVGNGLSPGLKRMEWDSKAELGETFTGELSFEIKAELIAVLAITSEMKSEKRGKMLQLEWRGGKKEEGVKIELLKDGKSMGTMGSVANQGTFHWVIPSDQKTGSDYRVRLLNGNETVISQPFAIKHKIPTLLKVLPFVAAGTVIALSGSKSTSTSLDLPSPPGLGLD